MTSNHIFTPMHASSIVDNSPNMIGCEPEIYVTTRGYAIIDPNVGKLGGGKRLCGYPARTHPEVRSHFMEKLERITSSQTWDVNHDCYIFFDLHQGAPTINGKQVLSPYIQSLTHSINARGMRVLGYVGRSKTFPKDQDSWIELSVNGEGELTDSRNSPDLFERLRTTNSLYLGCHFIPAGLMNNDWDHNTKRNGLVNNCFDHPGVGWTFLRGLPNTPYNESFIVSKNDRVARGLDIPVARDVEQFRKYIGEFKKEGYAHLALKKIKNVSIGGSSVSFIGVEDALQRGKDQLPLLSLVVPYCHVEPTTTSIGDFIFQSRIIYSCSSTAVPEFAFAKMYPANNIKQPFNLSDICPSFAVWDLHDNLFILESPAKGEFSVRRVEKYDMRAFTRHFENIVTNCFPQIETLEKRFQREASRYDNVYKICEDMRGSGLIPFNEFEDGMYRSFIVN